MFFFNTMLGSMENYYKMDREYKLLTQANVVAGHIAKQGYLQDPEKKSLFDTELETKSKEGSFRILVLDNRGVVVNDTNKTEVGKTYLIPEVVEALQKNSKMTTNSKEAVSYASASIVNDASEKLGVVLIVASVKDIYLALSEIEKTSALFTGLTVVILLVLVFFVSQLLLDPLNNVLKVVQKMSQGHLNQRIVVKGQDEFADLAFTFNNMCQKLEQVEKTREEFVSNVSHELKTPLSSIKVLTESILLEESAPKEMYREFLQDINGEIDRMTNIVVDLLNLVKLDQRDVGLNIKKVDLNLMLEDILKRLYPLAEQKNIELLFEDAKSVSLEADDMKLSLALTNLVENGIKYTPPGGMVKVIADCDNQNAYITVQDTGIGISQEEHEKVFNRFYRVDKTRDRETGGTGLGLSITHSTVLLHNGSIHLTSKENEGTTFVVRIPLTHTTP